VNINYGEQPFLFDFNMKPVQQQGESAMNTMVNADIIPLEILVEIFTFSVERATELLPLFLTCHWWNSALSDSCSFPLWQKLSKVEWPYLKECDFKVRNWGRFYKTRKLACLDMKMTMKWLHKDYVLPIENCANFMREIGDLDVESSGLEWQRKCPLLIMNLTASYEHHSTSFHCEVCNEDVYKVYTQEELLDRTMKGQCVLYFVGKEHPDDMRARKRQTKMGKVKAPTAEQKRKARIEKFTETKLRQLRLEHRGSPQALTKEDIAPVKEKCKKKADKQVKSTLLKNH